MFQGAIIVFSILVIIIAVCLWPWWVTVGLDEGSKLPTEGGEAAVQAPHQLPRGGEMADAGAKIKVQGKKPEW